MKMEIEIMDFFTKEELNRMAKETGFTERSSPIDGFHFALTFTTGFLNTPEGTLSQLVSFMQNACGVKVSQQALDQRICQYAKEFMSAIFTKALQMNMGKIPLSPKVISQFSHIYLIDSTNFTIHKSLKDIFKGPGGSASEAMVRIQFAYDYVTGGMFVEIGDAKTADAPTLEEIVRNVKVPCDGPTLFIADLGYFKVATYRMVALGELQFFLSKLKINTAVLDEEGNNIDIREIMRSGVGLAELKIYMGGILCRLLIQKLPDEVVNRKLRDANREAQKKGRTLSKDVKLSIQYAILVTNLPDSFGHKALFTMYRLRWQVELIFKAWKSILKIHKLRNDKENRVWCEVFGKLIMAVFADRLTRLCIVISGKEMSTYKTLNNLQAAGIILSIKLVAGGKIWSDYLDDLISQTIRLCRKNKQKNKPHISLLMKDIHVDEFCFGLA
jgi:hypothetical protein